MMIAKGRYPKPSRMNKTEALYANYLEIKKKAGEVLYYRYESVKLRLADNTFYTPDFLVINKEGYIEFHEVKGYLRDDAAVKFKVAADQYDWARWVMLKKDGKSGLSWEVMYEYPKP